MKTIKDVMDSKIDDYECSVRCINCMKRLNIKTLAELTRYSLNDLLQVKNNGKKSIEEITKKISDIGLWFQMNDRDWLSWGVKNIEWIKTH